MAAALSSSVCVLLVVLPLPPPPVEAQMPGSFFWKPRVALDLASPKGGTQPRTGSGKVKAPTAKDVMDGYAVGINGFKLAMAAAAVASYVGYMQNAFPHLHPCRAHFWTNAYRWALRHLSLLPDWLGGDTKYVGTHRVWRKRFSYMENFVPKWIRPIFYCVSDESWELEEKEWAKFVKYAEPHFGKYYRYPSQKFNNHNSFRHVVKDEELSQDSIE
ncbi:uncharacterized protein LOC111364472 [Spodoptera litura]|uniref:Uncharacterized protein LOC111364472 n=1 Tax=Spodoptera litura TaxID=69820 RepID=A0A9J7ERF4_SPOLT|nr:uncharacterized protein LOC111364472 [Spodoptera litura]